MSATAPVTCLITISGPDSVGLISAITGYLFDSGANLADSSFAVLGSGFEFSTVADLPADLPWEVVEADLKDLPQLAFARITVTPYPFAGEAGANAAVTHLVSVDGGDQPGLIARLSEVFQDYGANVVRMNAARTRRADGSYDYATNFAVHIPEARAAACTSAIHNTAGQLNLNCHCEELA